MTHVVTPTGDRNWEIFIGSTSTKFQNKLMAFIRSENAITVTLQVISVLSLERCVIKAIDN